MPSKAWTCGECETKNHARQLSCEVCGSERPSRPQARALDPTAWCVAEGAELTRRDGGLWCETGRGYAVAFRQWARRREDERLVVVMAAFEQRCPFVCPTCRGPLRWSGACFGCAREPFPGDGYLDDETGLPHASGHYRLVTRGPQALATPEQVAGHLAALAKVVTRVGQSKPEPESPDE